MTRAAEPPLPELPESTKGKLRAVRTVGTIAAVAGLGMLAYAVAVGATGPIGWGAALVFFGGLAAYLAHRRLKGHDDFSPSATL